MWHADARSTQVNKHVGKVLHGLSQFLHGVTNTVDALTKSKSVKEGKTVNKLKKKNSKNKKGNKNNSRNDEITVQSEVTISSEPNDSPTTSELPPQVTKEENANPQPLPSNASNVAPVNTSLPETPIEQEPINPLSTSSLPEDAVVERYLASMQGVDVENVREITPETSFTSLDAFVAVEKGAWAIHGDAGGEGGVETGEQGQEPIAAETTQANYDDNYDVGSEISPAAVSPQPDVEATTVQQPTVFLTLTATPAPRSITTKDTSNAQEDSDISASCKEKEAVEENDALQLPARFLELTPAIEPRGSSSLKAAAVAVAEKYEFLNTAQDLGLTKPLPLASDSAPKVESAAVQSVEQCHGTTLASEPSFSTPPFSNFDEPKFSTTEEESAYIDAIIERLKALGLTASTKERNSILASLLCLSSEQVKLTLGAFAEFTAAQKVQHARQEPSSCIIGANEEKTRDKDADEQASIDDSCSAGPSHGVNDAPEVVSFEQRTPAAKNDETVDISSAEHSPKASTAGILHSSPNTTPERSSVIAGSEKKYELKAISLHTQSHDYATPLIAGGYEGDLADIGGKTDGDTEEETKGETEASDDESGRSIDHSVESNVAQDGDDRMADSRDDFENQEHQHQENRQHCQQPDHQYEEMTPDQIALCFLFWIAREFPEMYPYIHDFMRSQAQQLIWAGEEEMANLTLKHDQKAADDLAVLRDAHRDEKNKLVQQHAAELTRQAERYNTQRGLYNQKIGIVKKQKTDIENLKAKFKEATKTIKEQEELNNKLRAQEVDLNTKYQALEETYNTELRSHLKGVRDDWDHELTEMTAGSSAPPKNPNALSRALDELDRYRGLHAEALQGKVAAEHQVKSLLEVIHDDKPFQFGWYRMMYEMNKPEKLEVTWEKRLREAREETDEVRGEAIRLDDLSKEAVREKDAFKEEVGSLKGRLAYATKGWQCYNERYEKLLKWIKDHQEKRGEDIDSHLHEELEWCLIRDKTYMNETIEAKSTALERKQECDLIQFTTARDMAKIRALHAEELSAAQTAAKDSDKKLFLETLAKTEAQHHGAVIEAELVTCKKSNAEMGKQLQYMQFNNWTEAQHEFEQNCYRQFVEFRNTIQGLEAQLQLERTTVPDPILDRRTESLQAMVAHEELRRRGGGPRQIGGEDDDEEEEKEENSQGKGKGKGPA